MNNTFTPSRLARLAYHAMVENAARIQEQVVQQEAINARFGDDALPVSKLLRGGFQNQLRDGEFKRNLTPSLERHAEYITAIREFEKLFEIEERDDMEAFARAFKDRMRSDEGRRIMNVEIWPVIHLSPNSDITLENANIAQRCGCPGVFLISMSGEDRFIDVHAQLIREQFKLKIGINMLTMDPYEALGHSLRQKYDATWSDYNWKGKDAEMIRHHIEQANSRHKFFAAVAMKGETHDELHPDRSARKAVRNNFIPMTSGSSTGVTAPFEKIEMLRKAIGPDAPLAMSGVHPPTANKLVPLTTHWLVATAISDDFYRFNEGKLQYLAHQAMNPAD